MRFHHILLFIILTIASTNASVVYFEFDDGDLPATFASPTQITVTTGDNFILGSMGRNGEYGAYGQLGDTLLDRDADVFSINVPLGYNLTGITVQPIEVMPYPGTQPGYSSDDFNNTISFIAYTSGSAFTFNTAPPFPDFDGRTFFGENSGNFINDLTGSNSLGSGDYSFWLQETANTFIAYSLNFTVTAVPEPTAASLLAISSLGLVLRRKRA